jgi:hypothetical protein
LDPESLEDLDFAVIHPDRDREVKLALRPSQELTDSVIKLEGFGHSVELTLGHGKGVKLGAHGVTPADPIRVRP